MELPPSAAWKLVLACVLGATILSSLLSRPPRRAASGEELRRLILAAIALYGVGGLASITRHHVLAALVYAAGVTTCALAAWLSRGTDSEDPPDGSEGADETPPQPDGLQGPSLEWVRFEAQFRQYAERWAERTGAR